jgi:hypothetical protein
VTRLEQLRHVVGILAASPEDQQSYLVEIGMVDNSRPVDKLNNIDELGLEFEDGTYLVAGLLRDHELTAKGAQCIEKLSDFMLQLSGDENRDFWTIQALYEDRRWTEVRALAQVCLSEMT